VTVAITVGDRRVALMLMLICDGHGRDEIRRLKAATVAGFPFPHADQALQIVRRRRTLRTGKISVERSAWPAGTTSPRAFAITDGT
jgi:hypothetical protein